MKLTGGALVYTLMISLIVSGLISAYLLIHHYQNHFQNRLYFERLAEENLRSGTLVYLNQTGTRAQSQAIALWNSEIDSAYFQTEAWGLFNLLHGRGVHGPARFSQSAFIGEYPQALWQAALYLADRKQPLSLAGKTELKGRLHLPAAGLRTSFVAGKGYQGKGSLKQPTVRSSSNLPRIPKDAFAGIRDLISSNTPLQRQDYLLMDQQKEYRAWDTIAFEVRSNGSLIVRESELKGKCMLLAREELVIEASTKLEHTLLFGKHIRIKAGFTGTIQAFATESLIVESGVKLGYPSVLFLGKANSEAALIELGSGVEIEGAVFFLNDFASKAQNHRNDYCLIGPTAKVWGQVYASGNLDLRGSVYGHVYTGDFLLKAPASRYVNHLLDATIDQSELSDTYLGPIIHPNGDWHILSWLHPQTPTL